MEEKLEGVSRLELVKTLAVQQYRALEQHQHLRIESFFQQLLELVREIETEKKEL